MQRTYRLICKTASKLWFQGMTQRGYYGFHQAPLAVTMLWRQIHPQCWGNRKLSLAVNWRIRWANLLCHCTPCRVFGRLSNDGGQIWERSLLLFLFLNGFVFYRTDSKCKFLFCVKSVFSSGCILCGSVCRVQLMFSHLCGVQALCDETSSAPPSFSCLRLFAISAAVWGS